MGELFHGWSKKIGFVTLLISMLLANAWLLSIHHRVAYAFNLFGKRNVVESDQQCLIWGAEVPHSILWNAWAVPYWTFVVPLTLLSVYLILWRPRKRELS